MDEAAARLEHASLVLDYSHWSSRTIFSGGVRVGLGRPGTATAAGVFHSGECTQQVAAVSSRCLPRMSPRAK